MSRRAALVRLGTSIRTRLTLGAVAALAGGIAVTTMLLVDDAERATLASQRGRELHEAVRTADVLARRGIELQRALIATANVATVATLEEPRRMRHFLEAAPVLRGMFTGLFIADAKGRVLLGVDGEKWVAPNTSIADRDYFLRTIGERRAIVSDPVQSRATGAPVVTFTAPLIEAGEVHGMLAGVLRLSSRDLLADLIDRDAEGADTLQIVTDATGRILAHPDRSRILKSLDSEPRMAEGFARWRAAGAPAEPAGLLFDQTGEVLSIAAAPGPDWIVWRALPEAELLAPLRAARRQALTWAAVIVAGSSLLVFVVIGWLLRPLDQLKRRARHLFDAAHPIDAGWPSARGEIGELTHVLRHVGAERAQLERVNAQVMARLASVMEAAPVGILFTRNFHFELVSAQLCRLFHCTEEQVLGRHVSILFDDRADSARLRASTTEAFEARRPYAGEWKMRRRGGGAFWASIHVQPVQYEHIEAGAIWTMADVSEARAEREELAWSARHDALTGLANRKLFEQRVAAVVGARPRSLPAALVMIDLDRFKPINDSAGHAAGDAMLKAVAAAIAKHVRNSDLAARLGGDEFALLLERCPPAAARRVAEAVRSAIAQAMVEWQGRELSVGASLGIACLDAETAGVAEWMHRADNACYAAKAAGRDAVCVDETTCGRQAAIASAADEPFEHFVVS